MKTLQRDSGTKKLRGSESPRQDMCGKEECEQGTKISVQRGLGGPRQYALRS